MMKTKKFLIPTLLLCFMIFSASSCDDDDDKQKLSPCNLTGQQIVKVNNTIGVLTFTDTIPGIKLSNPGYFLFPDSYPSSLFTLPLSVCNTPEERFIFLKIGDSVRVEFSGRLEKLPPEVDALSEVFELTNIEILSN